MVEDIGEVTEDVGEITKDVEELSKDVDEISEDVEEISKEVDEMHEEAEQENISDTEAYARIEEQIRTLLGEINVLKEHRLASGTSTTKETTRLKKLGRGLKTIGKKLARQQ